MNMHNSSREKQLRQRVAVEAARLIVEQGIGDYLTAKRKAAERLGVSGKQYLPRNSEVEAALSEYQRIFHGERQPQRLRQLRETALAAMRFFGRFSPRLVGPVLTGTAGEYSEVNLHLFAETPEDVTLFLIEHRIPHEHRERRYRFGNDTTASYPVYRFLANDIPLDATVLPPSGLRQAPLSPVDGRPMRRASMESVEQLLREQTREAPPAG